MRGVGSGEMGRWGDGGMGGWGDIVREMLILLSVIRVYLEIL